MSEPVFFERGRSLNLEDIVALTGARAHEKRDIVIRDVAEINRAGPGDVVFAETSRNIAGLATCQASACFIPAELSVAVPPHILALEVAEPFRAFVSVATALYPKAGAPFSLFDTKGIAASALVHNSARLEPNVTVDPAAVIGPNAEIGSGTMIGPMAQVGPNVRIGRNCSIGAGASLTNALIGDDVTIQPGCRVGQEGFLPLSQAERAPHFGRVIIQNAVHIGANCTIDRGCYRDTVIGEGTEVDSLVPIASDVVIGRFCRIIQGLAPSGSQLTAADRLEDSPPADHMVMMASAVGSSDVSRMNRA